MLNMVVFACGHKYPWVMEGKDGKCAYCAGQYPNGEKCQGGKVKTNKSLAAVEAGYGQ